MRITVTDKFTGHAATIERHDLAETIGPWYPEAPDEVTQAISDLQDAVNSDDHRQIGLAEYLNLRIDHV